MTHRACATLSASSVFGLGGASHASDLPSYMGVMAGASRSSAGAIATKMVLPLGTGMNIAWAAQIQVARWMGVVADWKEAARRRVGQDLRSRQWHLLTCQIFRSRRHKQPPYSDRGDLLRALI